MPIWRVLKPVLAVRRIGPGADGGEALLQLVDIAAHRREVVHPAPQALVGEARIGVSQRLGKAEHQAAMTFRASLAEVRQAREVPEAADFPVARHIRTDGAVLAHPAQHPLVQCTRIMDQHGLAGWAFEGADEGLEAGIVERRIAPLHRVHRIEAVAFDGFPFFVLERRAAAGLAELAIGAEASRAACDLRAFGERQRPVAPPVILRARGEHDPVDVKVQPHADGVGGDDVIDFAGLVECDLRVAGAGRKRAHDDRRAAFLAAEEFGDRVDFLGAEGDDGGAFRQFGDLGMAGIAQLREARARLGLDTEFELLQQAAHRVGA